MKRIVLYCLLTLATSANAGVNGLTAHSRANCVNNETISWDAVAPHTLFTTSDHINASTGALVHSITTGWANTRRSAAVHWGEGRGGWTVHGYHWIQEPNKPIRKFQDEVVTNCDIYDGWWQMAGG